MIGTFRINKESTKQYLKKRNKKNFLFLGGLFGLVTLLMIFFFHGKILAQLGGVIIIFLLYLGIYFNLRNFSIFIPMMIVLNDQEIIRKGKFVQHTKIKYSEIGKVLFKYDGIVILRKGFSTRINLIMSKTALTNEDNIIFIPSMIENYEALKIYLKGKYKGS